MATTALFATVAPGVATAQEPAAATPWTVSVNQTTDLVDGQRIQVNVKAPADATVNKVEIQVCRLGYEFQPSTGSRANSDFDSGSPNCPASAMSTSADSRVVSTDTIGPTHRDEGAFFGYRVGVGRAAWPTENPTYDLTCNASNPCALVVQVRGSAPGRSTSWTPTVFKLEYRNDDGFGGCGHAADGVVKSSASDRMYESWIDWTRAACTRPGASGSPTSATFDGEGPAVQGFEKGENDLVYSALGTTEGVGFVPDGTPERASVATPVAVNATVLAVANGYQGSDGRPLPYSDIKLTADEVAALISGGSFGITPYLSDIYARNPQLASSGMFDTASLIQVTASGKPESTSWLLSRYLQTLAPDAWVVPDNSARFGGNAGRARVTSSSFGTASPDFVGALDTFQGLPILRKSIYSSIGPGGLWVVTDYATAKDLGLYPVAIENAAGDFVQPTDASITAAASTIDTSSPGPWVAPVDLTSGSAGASGAAPSASGVEPYPLTFVEYALSPAEPLRAEDCVPRAASQAVLADWLGYITGDAQASLPVGLVPLTPELIEQAKATIPLVGASATTGVCAGWTPDTPVVPGAGPSGPGAIGSFGSGAGVSGLLNGAVPASSSLSTGLGEGILNDLTDAVATTSPGGPRPDYAGAQAASIILTVVSFLAIAGASAVAAFRTSGRRVRRGAGQDLEVVT